MRKTCEAIEGQCGCSRPYFQEPGDRGLCCICERDARMVALHGSEWRSVVLAAIRRASS